MTWNKSRERERDRDMGNEKDKLTTKHVFFHNFQSHIICHRIIQLFHSSSKSVFLSPSGQKLHCFNLLKHFRILWGEIWENTRAYQSTFSYFWSTNSIEHHCVDVFIFILSIQNVCAGWFHKDTLKVHSWHYTLQWNGIRILFCTNKSFF